MTEPTRSTTAFAKTARPVLDHVVARESLFALLDGTPARKLAWIHGAPGAGKSTLAASYLEARHYRWGWYQLDPEDEDVASFFHYLSHAAPRIGVVSSALPRFDPGQVDDVASFSRLFFRRLFAGAAPATALVLDNLHPLVAGSALHVVLEAGLSQVPRQCCVIITSRAEPPAAWARMRAGGDIVCVGGEALRITTEELAGIADLRGTPLSPDLLARMQDSAQGWAAALVLMLEHAKIANRLAEPPVDATPKVVFEYLAGEIFDRFEPATRRFLLRIACLPRMTAEVAQALSGEAAATHLLRNLVHNDYFVRELAAAGSQVFVLHPLLRRFLLERAEEELPEAVSVEARRTAARLLYAAGQVEDAVALLIECRDWAGVAAIAAEQAELLLSQGRRTTLAGWLELLPPALLDADPALLCAYAASRLHASPRAARQRFEQAHALAAGRGDTAQRIRACSGVIDATLLEFDDLAPLDRWSGELTGLLRPDADASAGDAAANLHRALLVRDPANPALGAWLGQVATSGDGAELAGQALLARLAAALVQGDFARASAIGGGADALPPADITPAMLGSALLCLLDGDHQQALHLARHGLSGVTVTGGRGQEIWLRLLVAAASIGLDAREAARQALASLDATELRRGDRAVLHYLQAGLAWLEGDTTAALRSARSALLLAVEVGLPWLEGLVRLRLAQLLGESGDAQSAAAQWRVAAELATRLGSVPLRIAVELTEAALALAGDDEAAALGPLARGLGLARAHAMRHVIGVDAARVSALCALAVQRGIEPELVRALVRAGRLAPTAAAMRLKQWPWRYRIHALGGFGLQRGDEAVAFSAKGPGRPVELLKVLVALGGTQVRADQLADALWPNVDADYAYKSFTATLHRLRRIFEDDDAVLLRDGRVSLNKALVWLDTWALEDLVGEFEASARKSAEGAAALAASAFIDEVLALYRGPFLADDVDQMAYVARREQLRVRLVRHVGRLARGLEDAGRVEAAIDCHLRFIDADELCEALHRQLMACQQRQGDVAGALAGYERLRTVLAARLKTLPSPETQAAYAELRTPLDTAG
jgi:ATP/maltotriose-dependent transcriptional regulator MalT/DNA-binding SARP family transcriptional activator